jgi:predicted enzyme related to lactoylglutathione lyase
MDSSTDSPVVFFEMPAKDMGRAKNFYETVLGWDIDPAYDNYFFAITTDSDQNKIPNKSGQINGGIQKKDDTIGAVRLMIKVNDLDKTIEKVIKGGGQIKIPPKKIPGFYYSVIIDTEGNEVNLAEKLK